MDIIEIIRSAYLAGIEDKEDDREQWCQQGSLERAEELFKEYQIDGLIHYNQSEYQKYEFCQAINCELFYIRKNHNGETMFCECHESDEACQFTAKEFHHWLKDNGFKIVKEHDQNLCKPENN